MQSDIVGVMMLASRAAWAFLVGMLMLGPGLPDGLTLIETDSNEGRAGA